MLAADTDPQRRVRRASTLDGNPDQLADAVDVERLERISGEDAVVEIVRQETPLGIVAGEAERRLRQVVGAEGEELGVERELTRAERCTWKLDHRPAPVVDRTLLGDRPRGDLAQP